MTKRTGIIVAYDRSKFEEADRNLLDELHPYLDYVKVGLETMTAVHPESRRTIASLVNEFCVDVLGLGVMWDAKLNDIANTVEKTVLNIGEMGADFFTLHASISDAALAAAAKAAKEKEMVALAVTVLTDIDEEQCRHRYGRSVDSAVLRFALNAHGCGIGGLVCSPKELGILSKSDNTARMTKVIPGIRPAWAAANDQKRVMTPGEAANAGADYVVIGRPILQPPQGMSSLEAVKRIREELDKGA